MDILQYPMPPTLRLAPSLVCHFQCSARNTALLDAFICVVSLIAVARCAWLRRRSGASTSPALVLLGGVFCWRRDLGPSSVQARLSHGLHGHMAGVWQWRGVSGGGLRAPLLGRFWHGVSGGGQVPEVLNDANLTNAILARTVLTRSDLGGALIEGADFSDAVLDLTQKQALCKYASGTNPVTGVSTRASLGCGNKKRSAYGSPSSPLLSAPPQKLLDRNGFCDESTGLCDAK